MDSRNYIYFRKQLYCCAKWLIDQPEPTRLQFLKHGRWIVPPSSHPSVSAGSSIGRPASSFGSGWHMAFRYIHCRVCAPSPTLSRLRRNLERLSSCWCRHSSRSKPCRTGCGRRKSRCPDAYGNLPHRSLGDSFVVECSDGAGIVSASFQGPVQSRRTCLDSQSL
jgi:hypothetical protein